MVSASSKVTANLALQTPSEEFAQNLRAQFTVPYNQTVKSMYYGQVKEFEEVQWWK